VGTSTEIYDYLKLLFARIGITYSPVSGERVTKDSVSDVVDFVNSGPEGARYTVMCPLKVLKGRTINDELQILLSKGYTRVKYKGAAHMIEDLLESGDQKGTELWIIIDRSVVRKEDEDSNYRLSDSVQTAFYEGHGLCVVESEDGSSDSFSDEFEADGIKFEEPTVNFFSFNNPYGACKRCEGFGKILGIDPDLVIPDHDRSVYDEAIVPWRSPSMRKWLDRLLDQAHLFDFPVHRPIKDLSQEQYELLWTGNRHFRGLDKFFKHIESKTHKIQYRVMLSRYRGRTVCPDCKGTRLRKDASYVRVGGKSIIELVLMPIEKVYEYFRHLELSQHESTVARRILTEISNRLHYLNQVGLGYLTLNRLTSSLSGGEFQRIKLATSLGSALVGSMYILDEPSIGLHPRDTHQLIEVLKHLRDLGNSVIVVEHEEEIMKASDQIIDIGPEAGSGGGMLVFQGSLEDMDGRISTYTTRYLKGEEQISLPLSRRKWKYALKISGARENNLQNLSVKIPLGILTIITGVSGSGKSTLVKRILYPAMGRMLELTTEVPGRHDGIGGDLKKVDHIEYIDQNPIGKSSRSNPVTYLKAYDPIRQLFADQPKAKNRGYKPAYFSFNVDGGRCENCQGEGNVKIEMQFMADIYLTCEHCKGKRFKSEILEIKYREKDISDVLEMTIDDAMAFFADSQGIISRLKPLQDVGLGYVRLGQSSNTLSGGEAQRVKLAYFLSKGRSNHDQNILFIFDEPTTGLHFHDISKLLKAINALIDQGNSVVIIEHNVEVIKCADWIIDLGPEGGERGGQLVFEGLPEQLVAQDNSHTAFFLKKKLL
jgi:excinuclease ABC subunit A